MDTSEMRALLRGYLSEFDWNGGATKDALVAHLAGRDEALRTMLNQYVAEGSYEELDDVLSIIPAQAWQDVQGDAWRGAESLAADGARGGFAASRVGHDAGDAHRPGDASPPSPGFGQPGVDNGGVAGSPAATATQAERRVAPGARFVGGAPSAATPPERLVPVALSALAEGFGQAYNRQPAKAAGLLLLGLGLSTASGLNTWLVRRLFRAPGIVIGAERVRPVLLAAWAATYAFNLRDAWQGASRANRGDGEEMG